MIKFDYHLHTNHSFDSDASMEAMAERAVMSGLDEIAFTDHVDFIGDEDTYEYPIDYDEYITLFNGLKDKYSDRINLVLGVEIGLYTPLYGRIREFAGKYPFDFIIGSTHSVTGIDIYVENNKFFGAKTKKEAYDAYFGEVLNNIKNCGDFDVYGHFDYISRYGIYGDNAVPYKDYAEIIDECLKGLICRGKGLEVNTSGFRYGIDSPYPQTEILKRYKELGGEIITVGSDAHSPQHIGSNFGAIREMLKTAGFKAVCVYKNRKPIYKNII